MQDVMGQQPRVISFVAGLAVGLLMAALFVAGSVSAVARRGVRVQVPIEPIATQVRLEVQAAVRRELPGALGAARQTVPRLVADQIGQRLRETKVDVGGFEVPVPATAIGVVQTQVEQAVRAGFDVAADQVRPDEAANRMGERAYALVKQRMNQSVAGQVFYVKPWPFVTIPVFVEAAR